MTAEASERADSGLISVIETARISLRANPALTVHGAAGTHDRSDFLLIRLITNRDQVGFGEVSATLGWSGEDADSAEYAIKRVLAPALVGQRLMPIGALTTRMDDVLAGHPFTKAGLEIAAWDALGQTLGLSVAELLGGPYREEVPTKLSLSGDGDALVAGYEAAHALGFGAFKVKVGLGHDRDVERFRLARELVGPDTFLGADANGGWSRIAALETIRDLLPHRLEFIEQPVKAADLEGMRACRVLGVPVMADEAIYSIDDVASIVRLEAADAINVYVGKSGGMERAVRAIQTAAAFGIAAVVGSNGEMGVGAAAQLHVACAVETLAPFPSDIIGHHYYDEDILDAPLDIDGKRARLPDGIGLGVRPSDSILRRFA